MCLIVDNNVRDDVFGKGRSPAGKQLFEWLEESRARLVVGGRLYDELAGSRAFRVWSATAVKDGRLRVSNRAEVDLEESSLTQDWLGVSDDQHVIALARVSRARVLYTRDEALRTDFRNRELISSPHGRLYPLQESANAKMRRLALLSSTELCPNR